MAERILTEFEGSDDTERFAIRGLRIHLSGFLLRPLEEERLRTAVRRLLAE